MSKVLQTTCVSLFSMVALTLVGTTAMAQPYAYVANLQGNNISVVDTRTNRVAKTVSARIAPVALAATKDGSILVAALQASNAVSFYRTSDMALLGTVSVGVKPVQVGITPDDQYAYIVNQASNSVTVIDIDTRSAVATIPVATYPNGIDFTPDGSKAIVGSEFGRGVQVINTATRSVIKSFPTGAGPVSVAVAANGWTLYVANQYSGTVTVHDLNSGALLDTITGLAMPRSVALNPRGTRLLVANMNGASASIVDTATNNVIGKIAAGSLPSGVAISPDGSRVYITNANDYTMTVADIGGNVVAGISMVGIYPSAVVIPGSSVIANPSTPPPAAEPVCSYSLSQSSVSLAATGGSATITVTTNAGCPWSATEDSGWISFTGNPANSGSGSVGISVGPNVGPARSANITVAGRTYTVNQAAIPLPTFSAIRVNSGGPTYVDGLGRTWAADEDGPRVSTTAAIAGNPADAALYQKERYSTQAVRYSFSVPNGNYNVKLKFAEIYLTKIGSRVMDISINGQAVARGLDILSETRDPFVPLDKVYPVNVSGGSISIEITASNGSPKVNAVEITQ
ncbi:MAG: beta-propeller fold lactonase family protein [Bryobacterales bacterium]|nr:beta-propeller fold lactonase family protein [Bryobacterales bacterium]